MYVCGVSVCVFCECVCICVCVYWYMYVRVYEGGVHLCVVCQFVLCVSV